VNIGLWAHTDTFQRHWDLKALAEEFNMTTRTMFSNNELTDDEMAMAYSACDVTLAIGSGEGWGYPLAESLACGVPVIHGNYAGGAEFVPKQYLVQPVGFRGDGYYGIRRPIFNASDWADKVIIAVKEHATLPNYIDWLNAWPAWEKWLRKGIA
jgi:glycosyltransferase involved in cell wall biosynthesis